MSQRLENKKFKSVVHRVVVWPMSIMAIVVCITIISSVIGFMNMRQQMVNGNLAVLQISQNQLENLLEQMDHSYIEYWNSNSSYAYLKNFDKDTPRESYAVYLAETYNWMNNLVNGYEQVQGAFAYFENIDEYIFRGTTNFDMHRYLREQILQEGSQYNCWKIVDVEEKQYLINVKKYNNFYGGVWLSMDELKDWLNFRNEAYRGSVYMTDRDNNNTLEDADERALIKEKGSDQEQISYGKGVMYNYLIKEADKDVQLGILIPRISMISEIPLLNKGILLLAFLSILLIPVMALWLRRRIAVPVKVIDQGMQLIGEGNMDYRIPLSEEKEYDEFDRLADRFNHTMDQLNELEFSLYKTKIKEQQTELRYISQQIRPHFILNALNIIYTYDESEFPLVRKMVLYLTEYFRYIVNLKVDFVEVEKELRHVENYLKIQKERYLDRFDFFVEWEVATQKMLIPPLIIQTFVENCIKYGIKGGSKMFVYVLASVDNDRLKLMIADTGNGFDRESMDKIQAFLDSRQHQEDLGVGIENAIERMDILYGQTVDVKVRNALSGGAVVELYLPIMEENDAD